MDSRENVIRLHGELAIRAYRKGKLVQEWLDPNLIVSGARDTLAHLLGGGGTGQRVSHIAFGTSSTPAAPGDITITNPYLVALSPPVYPELGVVRFPWHMTEEQGDGMTIRESGLLTLDAKLFARRVRSRPIEKEGLELAGEWTIYF